MVWMNINTSLRCENSSPTAPKAFICNVCINHTSAVLWKGAAATSSAAGQGSEGIFKQDFQGDVYSAREKDAVVHKSEIIPKKR